MKKMLALYLLALASLATALPLSPAARAQAKQDYLFLQAAYAQRTARPERFALLRQVLQQEPHSAYIKQQLVAEALAVDVIELADLYADFIEDAQDDPEAWAVYGAYQARKNKLTEAVESYEKAVALDPDDERILYVYITLLASVDADKAAQALQDLAQSRPGFAPEIYTEMGRVYLYHQKYPQALDALNQAIQLDPTAPQPRLLRAGVYEKTNQYFLMLHELEELDNQGYQNPVMLAQMGSVYVLVQDLPKAETYFKRAKALDPSNIPAGYFLALLAEARGAYPEAANYLRETADYQDSAAKQVQVSYYQRKANQPQESFKTISQAYKQFSQNNEVAYLYAVALYEQDKYKVSARVLAPLVEQLPDNADVRLQYAFALEGQGKYAAMEEQLHILLEQNPRHAPALNLYAYSLALRRERLDEAAGYAARALAVMPGDESFIDTQVWIFYQQGKFEQAADLLRAISSRTLHSQPEMAYHAGMIYKALGQTELARRYLQLAADGGWKVAKKELKKWK